MTNDNLMEVESFVECSTWSILQYFWPALSDNWSKKPIFGLLESDRFCTGFTVPCRKSQGQESGDEAQSHAQSEQLLVTFRGVVYIQECDKVYVSVTE